MSHVGAVYFMSILTDYLGARDMLLAELCATNCHLVYFGLHFLHYAYRQLFVTGIIIIIDLPSLMVVSGCLHTTKPRIQQNSLQNSNN